MSELTGLAETVLAKFDQQYWGDRVPVIDELGQKAAQAYFAEKNMKMMAGSLSVSGDVTIGLLIRPEIQRLINRVPNVIVGPYFLSSDYYPQGVGLWSPQEQPELIVSTPEHLAVPDTEL
jgi:hypothetical protein